MMLMMIMKLMMMVTIMKTILLMMIMKLMMMMILMMPCLLVSVVARDVWPSSNLYNPHYIPDREKELYWKSYKDHVDETRTESISSSSWSTSTSSPPLLSSSQLLSSPPSSSSSSSVLHSYLRYNSIDCLTKLSFRHYDINLSDRTHTTLNTLFVLS